MKKKVAPSEEAQTMDEEETNAISDAVEDVPEEPLPAKGLPILTDIEVDKEELEATKKGGKGLDKALKILDEYEKGVPPRNPHVQNYEE